MLHHKQKALDTLTLRALAKGERRHQANPARSGDTFILNAPLATYQIGASIPAGTKLPIVGTAGDRVVLQLDRKHTQVVHRSRGKIIHRPVEAVTAQVASAAS